MLRGSSRKAPSNSTEVVNELLRQIHGVFPGAGISGDRIIDIAFGVLGGIEPRDQIEGLLAVQMFGTHNLAMEFLGRAAFKDQAAAGVDMNPDRATKPLRTFALQIEALKRHRGGSEQRVVVEHVHVHRGGKAIVGAVSHGKAGGGGE